MGATEVSEEAAKRHAIELSNKNPGVVYQGRYRVNANAAPEVRWEAVGGQITEVTGAARKTQ
jgi:hypothetical protein